MEGGKVYVIVGVGDRTTGVGKIVGVEVGEDVAVPVCVAARLETTVGVRVGVNEAVSLGVAESGREVAEGVRLAVGEEMPVRVKVDVRVSEGAGVQPGVTDPRVEVREGVHVDVRVKVMVGVNVDVPVREGEKMVFVGVLVNGNVSDGLGVGKAGSKGVEVGVMVEVAGMMTAMEISSVEISPFPTVCPAGSTGMEAVGAKNGMSAPE